MAKLFVAEIDGQKIVVDFYVESEQAWQKELPPDYDVHPFEFKIWHPHLSETFGMVLSEQLAWIDALEYAGIDDWRIGCFWDTIPLKASIFGGILVGGVNRVSGFDTTVYFTPTTSITSNGTITYITHGRTGDEWGDLATGGNGAMIEAGGTFPDPNDVYATTGVPVPGRVNPDGSPNAFYTLIPTHGQDHWANRSTGEGIFDDDINCTPEDLLYVIQRGEHPLGAWAVSETMPQLSPPDDRFHTISISDVINPEVRDPNTGELLTPPMGTLVSVAKVEIFQDEPVGLAADAKVIQATETTYVQVRAEREPGGNGRVYHISFTDRFDSKYTFKVGVPRDGLVDDGALYDSTK
jgi:hypothetical protein